MGNPYYIPPGEAPLTGLTRNIMALSEMKQRGDIAKQGQLNEQEQLMQGNARNELVKQNQDFEQKKFKLENPHLANYSANEDIELRTTFNKLGLKNSSFVKESEAWVTNPEMTKGAAYLKMRGKHKDFIKELSDFYVKNSEQPGFVDSEQAQNIKEILEIGSSKEGYEALVDGFFPEVSQVYRAQEAEAAAKMAKETPKMGTLYKTDKGFLPAEQAVGLMPYKAPAVPKEPKEPKEEREPFTAQQIFSAEKSILNSKEDQDISAEIDVFNQGSRKPYVYQMQTTKTARYVGSVRVPGSGGEETKLKKVRLPVVGGKQVTAKDVADTANARGMSYDEALNAILTLSKGRK